MLISSQPQREENSNRPLLHLMPELSIIRVFILMLWTSAWEQISVIGREQGELKKTVLVFPLFTHMKRRWVMLTTVWHDLLTQWTIWSNSEWWNAISLCWYYSNTALTSADRVILSSPLLSLLMCSKTSDPFVADYFSPQVTAHLKLACCPFTQTRCWELLEDKTLLESLNDCLKRWGGEN